MYSWHLCSTVPDLRNYIVPEAQLRAPYCIEVKVVFYRVGEYARV